MGLPDNLIEQYRTVALERLDRIESGWEQVIATLDVVAAEALHRELHTLKGESRLVGFLDVDTVCHKLEDLLDVARGRGYAVDEDFDLAVNMAVRFMVMLVRKRVGTALGGFDLPGFVRHIDQLVGEARRDSSGKIRRAGSLTPLNKVNPAAQVSTAMRERLGPAAVDAFIEYACARGPRRSRLRGSWYLLRELISFQRAVVSTEQLAKHRLGAIQLARELGKPIDCTLSVVPTEVTVEVLAAIDAAVVHLVRNAVDHGIESAERRAAVGKPATGQVKISGRPLDGAFELVVEDDGSGVDYERVRARAIELGIVGSDAELSRDEWFDVMCQPAFSTRTHIDSVSGRGVGLDAVRAAIGELAGELSVTSVDGRGAIWRARVPVPNLAVHGLLVRAPNVPFPIMLDGSWRESTDYHIGTVIDVAAALGLADSSTGRAVTLVRDGHRPFSLLCDSVVPGASGRQLVLTPPSCIGSVVTCNGGEALLLRPDRIIDAIDAAG